jgi:drug/metabolite transporter (DMT)-like permease
MHDMSEERRVGRHAALLLVAAAIWGFAFVAQRAGMEHVGPFTFNGLRFLLGSLALLPVLARTSARERRSRGHGPSDRGPVVRALALVGVVLFAAASLQQVGLAYTTAGRAGFITGLYLVIIPFLGLVMRQQIRWTVWAAAFVAIGGLYLVADIREGRIGLGDGLVFAGAFGWAIHVQVVGHVVRWIHPIRIAVVQTAICGSLSLAVAVATERITWVGLRAAVPALLFAGVLSVGVAYTLQVVGQRRIDPSRAGILVSLEAVFAVLGGWLVLGERVSGAMLVGCALMLAGMVLSQLRGREERSRTSSAQTR